MAPQPAKRRKLSAAPTTQDLDVDGDQDWQSDELSSLPGSSASSDESESESAGDDNDDDAAAQQQADEDDDEEDAIDMLKDSVPGQSTNLQVVIPSLDDTATPAPEKKKRGRPRKERPPKIPKKRGRPKKYAPGEVPVYRRDRRKYNPDGTPVKRGRPKKEVKPEDLIKVPKKRGRPRKHPIPEGDADGSSFVAADGSRSRRKPTHVKKEFDLLADLDLSGSEQDDQEDDDLQDDDNHTNEEGFDENGSDTRAAAKRVKKEQDILAKLRRRILFRQHDVELADFVDGLPDPTTASTSGSKSSKTKSRSSNTNDQQIQPDLEAASPHEAGLLHQDEDVEMDLNAGPRPGLPLRKDLNLSASDTPSSEKRKPRQPFEPGTSGALDEGAGTVNTPVPDADSNRANASTPEPVKRGKGRPPGSKNKKPDWENNPLLKASRSGTTSNGIVTRKNGIVPYNPVTSTNGLAGGIAENGPITTSGGSGGSHLVKPTSSDAYFLFNSSKRARGVAGMTIGGSSNLISDKLAPLKPSLLEPVVAEQTQTGTLSNLATQLYRKLIPLYLIQLLSGYSILFYGVGNKLRLLKAIVQYRNDQVGDTIAVVVQGGMKGFKVEDMLIEIERSLGLGSISTTAAAAANIGTNKAGEGTHQDSIKVSSTLTISRAERIVAYFNQPITAKTMAHRPSRLMLLLETFDSPAIQNSRFRAVMNILGSCKNIHLLATVEHINSGLCIHPPNQTSLHLEHTPEEQDGVIDHGSNGRGGQVNTRNKSGRICWIYQNMSTFQPSLDEILIMRSNPAFNNNALLPSLPSSLDLLGSLGSRSSTSLLFNSNSGSANDSNSNNAGANNTALYNGLQVSDTFKTVSEQSAISILKSVTMKARALFNLLAKQIINNNNTATNTGTNAGSKTTEAGVEYSELLTKAKKSFLVSNESDFKSLLIEFKDHDLFHLSKQGVLRIGLENRQTIQSVLDKLKSM